MHTTILDLFTHNLLSAPILFFSLGVAAGFLKSDLEVPEQISRYLAIYLMMAIGFKGGVAIANTETLSAIVVYTVLAAIAMSFCLPFIAYAFLKASTRIDRVTAAALAAHYGSISMVTFVTTTTFLASRNESYAGYMVAVLALMEAPAIISGLFIANRVAPETAATTDRATPRLSREIFTNGAILLLSGAFLIGWVTGQDGMEQMHGFLKEPFHGILALFLLDMGLVVARELHHMRDFSIRLILFGFYFPLISASIALCIAHFIGLEVGSATLFMVLAASASYIAVPAAMRLALPHAKASIYIPMSLAVTFPFNIAIGIPLYYSAAAMFLK